MHEDITMNQRITTITMKPIDWKKPGRGNDRIGGIILCVHR